jgi:NAD(P)-dependent dehydrogenase (short-subunit alcohol dehydrogenase family)
MSLGSQPTRAVAIVTGGSSRAGRDAARALADWAWPIVLVYLEDPSRVETTAAEIIAAGGTTVAVRADLTDELDVERIFTESIASFGGVDVVVHTTMDSTAVLYLCAARHVSRRGVIVSTSRREQLAPEIELMLRERGIAVERVPAEALLDILDSWRQKPGV